MKTKKRNFKKKASAVASMLMIFALLLLGTYAWNDFSQHKTNVFTGTGEIISVTLNDLYTPPDNWKAVAVDPLGATVAKNVSVTNTEKSTAPVFVRLSIKEYMESQTLDPNVFIMDPLDNTKPLLFATWAEDYVVGGTTIGKKGDYMLADDGIMASFGLYGRYTVTVGYDTNGNAIEIDYATTNTTELRNGIYGKPMIDPGSFVVWGNAPKANITHELQSTQECDYNPYIWDGIGLEPVIDGTPGVDVGVTEEIRDHISIEPAPVTYQAGVYEVLQPGDIVALSEWHADFGAKLGPYWIFDDVSDDGWVYWGMPLEPGTHTTDLIEELEQILTPGYMFEYYMHIDMEAIGGEDFADDFDTVIADFYDDGAANFAGNTTEKQELLNLFKLSYLDTDGAVNDGNVTLARIFKVDGVYGDGTTTNTGVYYKESDTTKDVYILSDVTGTTIVPVGGEPQYIYDPDNNIRNGGNLPEVTDYPYLAAPISGSTSVDPAEYFIIESDSHNFWLSDSTLLAGNQAASDRAWYLIKADGTVSTSPGIPVVNGIKIASKPDAVTAGRTLTINEDGTGTNVAWVEIAKNGNYSLIVRTQVVSFAAAQAGAQTALDTWFASVFTSGTVGTTTSLSDYTMENTMTVNMGTSLTDGFSAPTSTVAAAAANTAFSLSYSEAAAFCSYSDAGTMSSANAIANWNKLIDRNTGISGSMDWWLRSTGYSITGDTAGAGDIGTTPATGEIRPALWVDSTVFSAP